MHTEFASIAFPRKEAAEFHRAVLARYIVEEQLRQEQGLESTDPPAILEPLEAMLGLTPEQAHALFHRLEDELWEYAWFRYTDEWAWFRARQDVMRELGKRARVMKRETLETRIEERYGKDFERYVAEIDMHEPSGDQKKPIRKKKAASASVNRPDGNGR